MPRGNTVPVNRPSPPSSSQSLATACLVFVSVYVLHLDTYYKRNHMMHGPSSLQLGKLKKKKKRGTYKVILKVKHTAYQVLKHIIITDYPHAPTCQASFIQPVFSRFVPIVTCVRTSSPFMAKWCSVVWLDEILFIHSPTDGHF